MKYIVVFLLLISWPVFASCLPDDSECLKQEAQEMKEQDKRLRELRIEKANRLRDYEHYDHNKKFIPDEARARRKY